MYKPSDAYYKEFTTATPSTGAAANADSTPTATANHNGTDDGSFTLTVTNLDTGRYKITGTVPSGYAKGDVVNVTVAATCSTIAGKAVVDTFNIDSLRVGDLNNIAATAIVSSGAITTSGGKISEVVLVDTVTTYTGNTPQTGDGFARIGSTGSGLTSLAQASTALTTATWTGTLAANLAAIYAKLPVNAMADETLVIAATTSVLTAVGTPMQAYTQPTGFLAATFPTALASPTNITAGTITAVTDAVSINLSQTGLTPRALDTVSDASLTLGDALVSAICAAAGKQSVVSTAYTIQTPHTGTTIRTFTLDSGSAPTERS